MNSLSIMQPILGVDFSGALLAGEKIWVSRARFEDGALRFDFLARASDLPGGASERDAALRALRAWIEAQKGAACGLDFPFALEGAALGDEDYLTWLQNVAARFPDAQSFRECGFGARRQTDIAAKTPFSPLNLRLYRQTYHGIRDVLAPLRARGARVLPFEAPQAGQIGLLEICPASLLKKEKLYLSYKGKSAAQRLNRELIAREMAARTPFDWSQDAQKLALDDAEGDALDAILAAVCVLRALQRPASLAARGAVEAREGRVYF